MIAAVVIVALASIAGIAVTSVALSRQAERGWSTSHAIHREYRNLLTARITTLENRLMADDNPDTFAGLQYVPDELIKATSANARDRIPESYGERAEELRQAAFVDQGADLEGESWEGPTVG